MPARHIVFDLDGTLVDSLPGIAEGVNRALRSLGKAPHPQEQVRGMIGRGAANLCAAAIGYADVSLAPAEELEAIHTAFRREYPLCWQGDFTRPYPGIPEMLEHLRAAGCRLAVLSNKPHDITVPMVQAIFPENTFDFVLGNSPAFPRKPAPDSLLHLAAQWGIAPADIVMVGDSLYDAQTADNAGCPCALFDWGYGRRGDLDGRAVFSTADAMEKHLLKYDVRCTMYEV